jgi:hypothetical protein
VTQDVSDESFTQPSNIIPPSGNPVRSCFGAKLLVIGVAWIAGIGAVIGIFLLGIA